MALTNATTLADYSSGIGTQGATLKVDANNKRVGIGTVTPTETLDVVGNMAVEGDISVTGTISYEDLTNVDAIGLSTFRAGINVTGGSVGIGTTNPGSFAAAADRLVVGNGSGNQGLSIYAGTSGESGVYFVDSVGGSQGQIFYRHSNDSLAFVTNNGSAALNIDSSGRLLVGTGSAVNTEWAPNLQVVGADTPCSFVLARNDTTVGTNFTIAAIRIFGNDSNGSYEECAQIAAVGDGDHATGDKPTRLVFSTTAGGASSPTERLRILSGGQVNIGGNYTQTTYTMQVTGTINATSNITQNGNALATNGKAIAMALIFG